MNIAIMSDIHSNYEALNSILKTLKEEDIKKMYVLGDVIGYGPKPKKCIERLRKENSENVLGNNEYFLINNIFEALDEETQRGLALSNKKLKEEDKKYIQIWETVKYVKDGGMLFFHGNIIANKIFNKILFMDEVQEVFEYVERNYEDVKIIFFGNTQEEIFYSYDKETKLIKNEKIEKGWNSLSKDKLYLVNPGSVARLGTKQNNSSALIFDKEEKRLKWRYSEYNVNKVLKDMAMQGMPIELSKKLYRGY